MIVMVLNLWVNSRPFDVFDFSGLWGTSGGNFDEESIFVLDGSTGGFDELFVLVTGFKMADVLLLLELLELVVL
jgi:hypothetical protein